MSETVTERQALERVEAAGLVIRRVRRGRGFSYLGPDGKRIEEAAVLARIRSLAIPPAYEEVRIAASASAHLQAIGRDAAGRLQYRYHPDWDLEREAHKAERLETLIDALPRIRAAVRKDIALATLHRRKAVACAVALIDATHIRVGCELYLQSSGARGAATLLKRQVKLNGQGLALNFRGKGGAAISCTVEDRALVRAIRRIATIRGSRLLQYIGRERRDPSGEGLGRQRLSEADLGPRHLGQGFPNARGERHRGGASGAGRARAIRAVAAPPDRRGHEECLGRSRQHADRPPARAMSTPSWSRPSRMACYHRSCVRPGQDACAAAARNALARLLRATRTEPG